MGIRISAALLVLAASLCLWGCAPESQSQDSQDTSGQVRSDVVYNDSAAVSSQGSTENSASADASAKSEIADTANNQMPEVINDRMESESAQSSASASRSSAKSGSASSGKTSSDELRAKLDITEDYRESFVHGDKPPKFQKYIVLHDTEGEGDASGIVDYWDGNGRGVAAHFIINKDGSIVQCVDLDKIAHHAGFGDSGHNDLYSVPDESRDDKVGTTEIGDWAQDYGMNSYSVGIEMVHVGGSGDYPTEQLEALDGLIAYIDAYYEEQTVEGFRSQIIDHKMWRTGNSDTSEEFAQYLANYRANRRHD